MDEPLFDKAQRCSSVCTIVEPVTGIAAARMSHYLPRGSRVCSIIEPVTGAAAAWMSCYVLAAGIYAA